MRPHWQREMLRAIRPRYRVASRVHKSRILDEFCAITRYHRKYAIAMLNGRSLARPPKRRGRPVKYDSEATRVLVGIWRNCGYPSSRRLKQLVPRWLPWACERYGRRRVLQAGLPSMGVRTMDRRLRRYREMMRAWSEAGQAGGRSRHRNESSKKNYGAEKRAAASPSSAFAMRGESSRILGNEVAMRATGVGERDPIRYEDPARKGGDMTLEMKTRKRGDAIIVSLEGEMVIGEEHFELMKYIVKEVKQTKKFVIDLGKVTKIDSAGVGELVAMNVAVKENDAQVRLSNLDDRVGKILQMALVHKMIDTYDTQKEALESLED